MPESEGRLPEEKDFSLDAVMEELQQRYIQVARELAGDNDALAARLLGFRSRQALAARCRALETAAKRKRSEGTDSMP